MNDQSRAKTSLARLGRVPARWVLVAAVGAAALCVAVSISPLAKGFADKPRHGAGDAALYRAEVDRMHAGEPYYRVANEELRRRGYPTRSVFNWRTPLPMWLIAALPSPVFGQAVLGLLAICGLGAAFELSAREGGTLTALVTALAMGGALMPCLLGNQFVMPVLWSGVLIVLSVSLLALKRTRLGVAAGVAALFVRELAGPYCAFSLALALFRRQFREAAMWALGLSAYGLFFLWHVGQVGALRTATDVAHHHGWVQFGGLAFVISMAQVNAFLLLVPQWATAIYFSLALLGFASWSSAAGERTSLTVALYVVLFGFIGQDFNQYWGELVAPLLALGVGRAPLAVLDLWRAARGQSLRSGRLTMSGSAASA